MVNLNYKREGGMEMTQIQLKTFSSSNEKFEYLAYDYAQNSYKELILTARDNGLRQVIFTTAVFKSLIGKVYEKGLFIKSINFVEPFEPQLVEKIQKIIDDANVSANKEYVLKALFDEIDFLVNDESIDIKKIEILNRNVEPYGKATIFNNGVLHTSEENKIETTNLLNLVLKEHV